MLHYVHSSLIYNCQKLERTQMPITEEWIQKIWDIYTMEYYSAIKKNEFMKFLDKWMDLEGIILSEVTQSQKNTLVFLSIIARTGKNPDIPQQKTGLRKCGIFTQWNTIQLLKMMT